MKIIKPFFLLTVGFCATTIVYAQDLKPEIAKPLEIKVTTPTVDNKQSPVPEFKPLPVAAVKEIKPVSVAETPQADSNDESLEPAAIVKAEAKTIDADAAREKLTPEQLKTYNGNSARPKEQSAMPNTADSPIRPALPKPAVNKVQQE